MVVRNVDFLRGAVVVEALCEGHKYTFARRDAEGAAWFDVSAGPGGEFIKVGPQTSAKLEAAVLEHSGAGCDVETPGGFGITIFGHSF